MNEALRKVVLEARSRKTKRIDWYEFVDIESGLCSLCGNTGIIKTTCQNPMNTLTLHYEGPCICPNGRAAKKDGVQGRTWIESKN